MNANNIYKIAAVFVAVVLGAGFATGQELISFFVRFGYVGFAGLALCGVFFAASAWAVLDICRKKNIDTYSEFMLVVCGKKLSWAVETTIALFLFILYATMMSAGGAAAREAFGLPFAWGSSAIALLCLLTFFFGLDGFVEVNAFLAPLMVAGGIIIGLYSFINSAVPVFFQETGIIRQNWVLSAMLYTSYNMLTAISVLCSVSKIVDSQKTAVLGSSIAGGVIALLGICMSLPLFINYSKVQTMEIPMLGVTRNLGVAVEYFYLFILLLAIFTTAVANGFSCLEWLKSNFNLSGVSIKIALTLLALLCSFCGFSNFVGLFYPLFGYLGLFEIALILLCAIRLSKWKK